MVGNPNTTHPTQGREGGGGREGCAWGWDPGKGRVCGGGGWQVEVG